MIKADFKRRYGNLVSFCISGHAGYDDAGKDIVCASVTSAVQLTANAITEILGVVADVGVYDNEIRLSLPIECNKVAYQFMESLLLHLGVLAEDYKGTIKLKVTEVLDNA